MSMLSPSAGGVPPADQAQKLSDEVWDISTMLQLRYRALSMWRSVRRGPTSKEFKKKTAVLRMDTLSPPSTNTPMAIRASIHLYSHTLCQFGVFCTSSMGACTAGSPARTGRMPKSGFAGRCQQHQLVREMPSDACNVKSAQATLSELLGLHCSLSTAGKAVRS